MPNTRSAKSGSLAEAAAGRQAGIGSPIDVQKLVSKLRRRFGWLVSIGLVVFAAVLAFTLLQTPQFSSVGSLIIDSRKEKVVESQEVLAGLTADTSVIDSEVEVVRSRALAERVVALLKLDADPEFNTALERQGFTANLRRTVRGVLAMARPDGAKKSSPGSSEAHNNVVAGVIKRLTVDRVGLTYVLRIGFQSESPTKAARIANAFLESYIGGQLTAKSDATNSAVTYLEQQLEGLSGSVQQADAAVAQYKSAHGLISAQGATLTEQEISTYNQQLATVRAEQAEEEARLRTARQQMAGGSNGDDVGEALNSPVVQGLREKRAVVSGRVADLNARYGARHPDLIRAQGELKDIDAQIQAEIRRIVSNLEARVSVAREKTGSLQGSLGRARGALASNTSAGVQLAELERTAASLRGSQESLMQRYQETSTQKGIQRPDARIVSRASAPARPSSPKVLINLLAGLVLAGGAGLAAVVLIEMLDSSLATAADVEAKLGIPNLGSIPIMGSVAAAADRRMNPIDHVIRKPLGAFAESFRSVRASVLYREDGSPAKIVTLTSSLPEEGKTTMAICLARVSAQAGAKVLLIDCDLRRRALTRTLGLTVKAGITEVVLGVAKIEDAMVLDEPSGLYILGATADAASKDVFGLPAMDTLLAWARAKFDLVIIDTPPVLAVAEARTLAAKSDAAILLVMWRKTPARAAQSAVRLLQQSGAPLAGATLTRVNMRTQARQGYGDAAYYYSEYKNYYAS